MILTTLCIQHYTRISCGCRYVSMQKAIFSLFHDNGPRTLKQQKAAGQQMFNYTIHSNLIHLHVIET